MAKLSKDEKLQRDTFERALVLVKSGGQEALEKRVGRNARTIIPAALPDAVVKNFCEEVKTNCIISFTCLMAMVLRDEFGFGNKRMAQFAARFYSLCDSVADEWLTYNDIIETIQIETGIDLVPFEKEASMLLREVESKINE